MCKTESEYFNRTIYNHLDNARKIEDDHRTLKDPNLLDKHPAYTNYGTIAICAIFHEEYSVFKKLKDWPSLEKIVPSSNHSPIVEEIDSGGNSCLKCQSNMNLTKTPIFLLIIVAVMVAVVAVVVAISPLLMIMMYQILMLLLQYMLRMHQYGSISIYPSNKYQTIEFNGMIFNFWARCTCYQSIKVGFYNGTHTNSQYITGDSPTTNDINEGESPGTDSNPFPAIAQSQLRLHKQEILTPI